ncbi:BON domain-containing protein [Rhizobium sp. FKL33]|uniref:BON domain-containing protein n=1 Tax=Rhizobium sp. FKL33 TaxID=2562307 RepID=UPI0010BFBC1B|nr:BON domain-containing protein [Rhizobium sp. FKL33]
MATVTGMPQPKTREEDYRDYDERDISDGWPYADEEVAAKKNEAYGVDSDDDTTSLEISDEPAIESEGGPSLFPEAAEEAVEDDGVEEAVYERITNTRRWQDNQLTVTVHAGVATLEGEVETEHDRQLINQIALGVPGVVDTVNRIILIGVDSHIPSDAD